MAIIACKNHPDQPSVVSCSQCHAPICASCTETVANQPVCHSCVSAIRARVANETNQAQQRAYPIGSATAPISAASAVNPGGLALGIVYGLVAGIVGSFILAKIQFALHFQWAYLNALVGYGVGYGILMGDKRGGLAPAVAGGVIAFFSMLLCEYFQLAAGAAEFAAQTNSALSPITPHIYFFYLQHINVISWIFIAFGVYGGFKTPWRAGSYQKY